MFALDGGSGCGGGGGGDGGKTLSIAQRWQIAREKFAHQKKREQELVVIIQVAKSDIAKIEREFNERNKEWSRGRNGGAPPPEMLETISTYTTKSMEEIKIPKDKIRVANCELEAFPKVPGYVSEETRDLIICRSYMDFMVGDSVLDTQLKCSVKILSKHHGNFMGEEQIFYEVQLDGAVQIIPEYCQLLTQGGISKLKDTYHVRHIDLTFREEEADDNNRRIRWPEVLLSIKREAYCRELEEPEKIKKSLAEAALRRIAELRTFPARFGNVRPGMTVSWTERFKRCAYQSWEEYVETFSGVIEEIDLFTYDLKITCSKTGKKGINKGILDVTFP